MPSICGLDPDDWQETCDTGMGYFWQWGWGLHGEPSTMPLWDRQLERPAPLPRLAAGMTPSAPHSCPRGPHRGQPPQGPSPEPDRRAKFSGSGSHSALGSCHLPLRTGLARVTSHPPGSGGS